MTTIPDERASRMGLASLGATHDGALARAVAKDGAVGAWLTLLADSPMQTYALRAQALDLDRLAERTEMAEARFVIPGDDEWPPQLDDLAGHREGQVGSGVPFGLWVRGEALEPRDAVSLTGARASSQYGEVVASDLAQGLTDDGCTVVTSLAYGIDAAALNAVLAAGGRAIAVAASGLSEVRMSGIDALIARLGTEGTLVSEHPPGTSPSRTNFLARARLIAALGRGTVLIEAGGRSGAKHAADWTIDLGKPLMAVPGPVTSALSVMPHDLIARGRAVLVTSASDVRETLAAATITDPSHTDQPERTQP